MRVMLARVHSVSRRKKAIVLQTINSGTRRQRRGWARQIPYPLLANRQSEYVEVGFYIVMGSSIAMLGGVMHEAHLETFRTLQQVNSELTRTEERLSLTLRSSGIGIWNWDIAANTIEADGNCSKLFGLPRDRFPKNIEGVIALSHSDGLCLPPKSSRRARRKMTPPQGCESVASLPFSLQRLLLSSS